MILWKIRELVRIPLNMAAKNQNNNFEKLSVSWGKGSGNGI